VEWATREKKSGWRGNALPDARNGVYGEQRAAGKMSPSYAANRLLMKGKRATKISTSSSDLGSDLYLGLFLS